MTPGNFPDRYNETKLPGLRTGPTPLKRTATHAGKKKKHPKAMSSRFAAAFGKTKTSTPAEPDDDDL